MIINRLYLSLVIMLTFAACATGLNCFAQDIESVRVYRLPNASWNRPLIQSKSTVLMLQRPVGPRNVPYDAILADVRDTENDLVETARYKDVATTATFHHADRRGFFKVSRGKGTLWNEDGSTRLSWKLAPEYFTTDAAVLSHFGTIALRSFNEDTKVFSIWWIDIKSDVVERIVTSTDMHLLSQPTTANSIFVNIGDEQRRFIREIDQHGTLGKSMVIPRGFLASSASADGLRIWGRNIHADGRSTAIAFFETKDPAKVTSLTDDTWDSVEPQVSALGEVAFCRKVGPGGTQHLCTITDGKVRTIHERLVPGGGYFNWSDSGTELVSIVLDDEGRECIQIDTIREPKD